MTVLAIHPAHNSKGKRDATGAFIPEARAWAELHNGHLDAPATTHVARFDNHAAPAKRRRDVEAILRGHRDLNAVGFFCHGLTRSLQTGHALAHVESLADALTACTRPGAVVALYACDAADTPRKDAPGGDGGFADALRDALVLRDAAHWRGGWVDAHVTTGHATRNPYVRRFSCTLAVPSEVPLGIVGGEWLVTPGGPLWRSWARALRETDLRLRFPLMQRVDIAEELVRV